jgi:hypothetical protein
METNKQTYNYVLICFAIYIYTLEVLPRIKTMVLIVASQDNKETGRPLTAFQTSNGDVVSTG